MTLNTLEAAALIANFRELEAGGNRDDLVELLCLPTLERGLRVGIIIVSGIENGLGDSKTIPLDTLQSLAIDAAGDDFTGTLSSINFLSGSVWTNLRFDRTSILKYGEQLCLDIDIEKNLAFYGDPRQLMITELLEELSQQERIEWDKYETWAEGEAAFLLHELKPPKYCYSHPQHCWWIVDREPPAYAKDRRFQLRGSLKNQCYVASPRNWRDWFNKKGNNKRKVGAKTTYDWEAFDNEMLNYRSERIIPPITQSILESYMLKWCLRKWNNEPSLSAIRRKVSPFYNIWKIQVQNISH